MIKSYIKYMKKPKDDEWTTPDYAIKPILHYLPKDKIIWCPFDTDQSNYVKILRGNGYKVINSHINDNKDFFNYEPEKWDILVSNPPFSIKDKILERTYGFNKPFALLLPLSALEGVFRTNLYIDHGLEILKFDKRIGFNKKEKISFPTAYFCNKLLPKQLIHLRLSKKGGDKNA